MSKKTVLRWCESGKLAAIPKRYGKKQTYLISLQAIQLLIDQQKQQAVIPKPKEVLPRKHKELQVKWKVAMEKGTLTGKPYSPRTVEDYCSYTKRYFEKHTEVKSKLLERELSLISTERIATRQHYHKAILCFAKYLVKQGYLEQCVVEEIREMIPKRHLPPKRYTVDSEAIERLLDVCRTSMDRLIVTLLSNTGLRASEACNLKWSDIDLDKGILTVRLGKGNKERRVGLNQDVLICLVNYRDSLVHTKGVLFTNSKGNKMDRRGLSQRLQRLGKVVGIKVSPHVLRRAFVTINANQGRPLQMLQQACGHSDIKTTMGYCMTSEMEVVNSMKEWAD